MSVPIEAKALEPHVADVRLLAVVEVPESDRIKCQATGCGRAVYRRIHVVTVDGALSVLGSDCFRYLVGEERAKTYSPRYGSVDGFQLPRDDRALLATNTAKFIENLELEELENALARYHPVVARPEFSSRAPPPARSFESGASATPRSILARVLEFSTQDLEEARARARAEIKRRFSIDPTLPGWKGFVEMTALEMLTNTYDAGAGAPLDTLF